VNFRWGTTINEGTSDGDFSVVNVT
jgi:hypothetical protein